MRAQLSLSLSISLVLTAAACDTDDPAAPDASTAPVDAGTAATPDAGSSSTPDAGAIDHDSGPPPVGGGALAGVITRSAMPAAGGVGGLYVAIFDRDPVTMRDTAVAVGRAIVEDADMREASAAIPYEVTMIPPRAAPYYVTAFLDDNGTVGSDPDAAGPDRGDLVALDGFASHQVVVDGERRVTLDLDLNFNLPF